MAKIISRRDFMRRTARAAIGGALGPAALAIAKTKGGTGVKKPNFIFILIDDMGWKDIACNGSEFYETPNVDGMAADGMSFSQAYASCPVCSPTRASVLTGKYPATVGITDWIGGHNHGKLASVPYLHYLPRTEKTLATALGNAGYRTWHVGKWHLGGEGSYPEDHGFQVNVGGFERGWPPGGYFSPYQNPKLPDGPPGECLTDRLTDESIKLIKENKDKPFFLNLWYYAVHTPIQAKQDLIEKYKKKAKKMGLDKMESLIEGEEFSCIEKKGHRIIRRVVQSDPVYAAMIDNLDMNIGRLLAAVKEAGEDENTIVVFYSDNGGLATAEGSPTSNLPLAEGKGWMYEGGTREPLIVRWPGVIKAKTGCAVPVTTTDFYPTFLALAGIPAIPDQHSDGMDISPLLQGKAKLDRDAIFWHYPHYSNQGGSPGCSLRRNDYKLIEFFEDGKLELYDLAEDPGEKNDLAGKDPRTVKQLHELLINWRQSIEAKIPERNSDYEKEMKN